jgi:hypothetical protein
MALGPDLGPGSQVLNAVVVEGKRGQVLFCLDLKYNSTIIWYLSKVI